MLTRSQTAANLDKIVAILGLALSLGLTLWLTLTSARYVYIACTIALVVICAAYLGLRKRLLRSALSSTAANQSSLYLILNIAFFALLAGSFLSIALASQPYVRPQGYFICTILAVAVLAAEILLLPDRKGATGFALAKVIAIALSLVWSQYLTFPTVLGTDPWYHQAFTTEILGTGHIPEGYAYSRLPGMHLMTGATSLITGLNYKMASIFSIGSLQVVCGLALVFLLGKLIYSAKAGLLAALLLGIASHYINLGWAPLPTTMAAIFIPIIIFLLFKFRREKEKRVVTTSLILLFFAALILTHTVTALCMALLLLAFWVGSRIYDWLFRERDLAPAINLALVVIFIVAMLGWWAYTGFISYLLGPILTLPLPTTPPSAPAGEAYLVNYWTYYQPGASPEVSQYMASTAFPAELFYHLGMVLFFAFSIFGVLYLISRRGITKNSFVICLSILIPLAFGFFPNPFNQGIMHRWWYFSQILLAIPLGVFFLLIYEILKDKIGKVILLAALIAGLTFLMVMNPVANLDSPAFAPERAVRQAFTESEVQAFDTASTFYDGEIGIDRYGARPLRLTLAPNNEISRIDEALVSRDYGECQDMLVLIREEVAHHPFKCYQAIYELPYEPRQALEKQGFSKVYDCGSVSGFISTLDV